MRTRVPGRHRAPSSCRAPRGLLLVVAGLAASACDDMPEPRVPAVEEAPAPRPRPPRAAARDWATFPQAERSVEPLQVTYDGLARAMSRLGKTHRARCAATAEEAVHARRAEVREALASVLPLVARSLGEAQKRHAEVGQLASSVPRQLEVARLPEVDPSTALLWLASEGLDARLCADADDAARWPGSIVAWATSAEAIYQTAFATFGRAWTRVSVPPSSDPWAVEGDAVAEVARRMLGFGAKMGVARPLRGARLVASPGIVSVGPLTGADAGVVGDRNGRVDRGEIVDLTLEIGPSGQDPLISESIVPKSIPTCVALPWREIVLPEVKAGATALVTLPGLIVSDRCGAKEQLELDLVSSSGAQRAAWSLELTPAPVDLRLEPPLVDADLPGHSDDGDPAAGVVPGRRLEVRPVARATGVVDAVVVNVALAEPADAPFVRIGPFASFALRPRGDGALVGEDDLDLTPASGEKFQETLDQRAVANALTVDAGGLWVALDVDAELPQAAAPAPEPITPKAKLAKLLRTKGKAAGVAATPSARGDANAAAYLTRLLPPGKPAGAVRPAIVGLLRSRADVVRAALASAPVVDPPVDEVVTAFASLAELRVLPPTVVHTVYDYLDRHRGARLRDPEARRLSRQILLAAAYLAALPPEVARPTLARLDLLGLDTAAPLPALEAALAPVALQAQLGLTAPLADSPGLRALVADLTAAAAAPEAPPGAPPDSYRFRRYLRLAMSARVAAESKP